MTRTMLPAVFAVSVVMVPGIASAKLRTCQQAYAGCVRACQKAGDCAPWLCNAKLTECQRTGCWRTTTFNVCGLRMGK